MLRSWKLGSAFGIGIYIHSTFLLLPALVIGLSWDEDHPVQVFSLFLVLAVFVCVVLHELGHALMARYFGIPTRDITLYPIGGVARLERMSESPWEEFCIAIAGPAVNVAIALLLGGLWIGLILLDIISKTTVYAMLEQLRTGVFSYGQIPLLVVLILPFANVGLFVFNMVPAFPMDGGRVLRAALASVINRLTATEIAAALGLCLAFLMMLSGSGLLQRFLGTDPGQKNSSNPMLIVVGLFVMFAGQQELYAVRQREAQRRATARNVLPPPYLRVTAGPPEVGFSGFTWDRDHRCWIEWRGGRPVHACYVGPE